MGKINRFIVWERNNRLKAKLIVLAGLWLIIILMFVAVKLLHWNETWQLLQGEPSSLGSNGGNQ